MTQRRSGQFLGADVGDPRIPTRPLTPGCSVGLATSTTGTLGALCRRLGSSKVLGIGNCHVLADFGDADEEAEVLQPGPAHGGTNGDFVARLDAFRPLVPGTSASNRVDVALIRMRPIIARDPAIPGIGRIAGTSTATNDLPVRKFGCMSGLTHGRIDSLEWTGDLSADGEGETISYRFVKQLKIDPIEPGGRFAKTGDSGSLILTASNPPKAVGLLCGAAKDESYGIASPIGAVLDPEIGYEVEFL